jgi:hypothetical protein
VNLTPISTLAGVEGRSRFWHPASKETTVAPTSAVRIALPQASAMTGTLRARAYSSTGALRSP